MSILKKNVVLGEHYAIKHTSSNPGHLSVIKIEAVCIYGGWWATNLKTGRQIRIRSATKLRYAVKKAENGRWVQA